MAVDFLALNEKAIAEFRANEGECGPPFEGTPIVLVTMVGAKSGRELCSPLAYSTDDDDLVVIASMGGAPNNPNWYHNFVANADVLLEVFRVFKCASTGDNNTCLGDIRSDASLAVKCFKLRATGQGRGVDSHWRDGKRRTDGLW